MPPRIGEGQCFTPRGKVGAMPTHERKRGLLRSGYATLAVITLLTALAAVLPGARSRDSLLAALVAAGWWLCICGTRRQFRLAEEASFDPLTGLHTRRYLTVAVDAEMTRAAHCGGAFALAILDLDGFKALNDEHGHLHGDEVLRAFGGAIRAVLRQSDVAFRYGGDECVVLFPGASAPAVDGVLERLRQQLPQVPFSGGVAEYPLDGGEPAALLLAADARLLGAKRAGKGRVVGALPGR